jgi:hypothetical protein
VRIEGEHKVYGRIADSGSEIRFHFCPNCGSSVFWEGDRSPTTCGIAVGCFADPDFPAPTSSGWEESMHPWLGAAAGYGALPAIALLKEWRRERRGRPVNTAIRFEAVTRIISACRWQAVG